MAITLLIDPWRPDPLAWIHRAEARAIARELRESGRTVRLLPFREHAVATLPRGPLVLRVSDPVMLVAARALARAAIPYIGPGAAALEQCYDKYHAYRRAIEHDIDGPATALAQEADALAYPLVLKPRRGSDSIGLRVRRAGPIPARARTDRTIAQEFVRGSELTVGALGEEVGAPLHILLPEGTPYRFWRKYLLPPRRSPVRDLTLHTRVREAARRITALFGVDWAARVDFIHETATDRLRFLECDAAPLVGPASAFAASLAAAGMERGEQLARLFAAAH
jgi:D-alanine-D-alanine ligase-like ATP-grasp enzyme